MSGSFIFYFHLLGFGLITTSVVAGWLLNLRFSSTNDLPTKIAIGTLMNSFVVLFPIASLLVLTTGIGNIFNLYYGTPKLWYQQGWLVVKIVLFGVMLMNGTVFGPLMNSKRMKLVRKGIDASEDDQGNLNFLNKQMNWYYTVQSVLLLGIVFFSAFGPSKHPGYF